MVKMLWRANARDTYPADAATRCPETLASWLRRFPDSRPAERDFEDWAESAAIGLALDAHPHLTTMLPDQNIQGFVTTSTMGGIVRDPWKPTGFMFGCWSKFDGVTSSFGINPVGCDDETVRHVTRWATSPVALEAAGRQVFITSAVDYGPDNTEDALAAIVAAGGTRVFVKSVHKLFAVVHPIKGEPGGHAGATFRDCDDIMHMQLHHDDDPGVIMIQEAIRPTHEYRLAIVDDEVVTGAGCIEPFVPFMNQARFDPRTEEIRNRSEVTDNADLVDRYVAFARDFALRYAAEAKAQTGMPPVYCLDLCVDASDGRIKLVELNPATGFGLYASDAQAYVDAVVALCSRMATERD